MCCNAKLPVSSVAYNFAKYLISMAMNSVVGQFSILVAVTLTQIECSLSWAKLLTYQWRRNSV